MPKVSVIIPIYGVEKYIERCVRHLLEQTLDDMEFIFVNDCTKDNSIIILNKVIREYPSRLSQISLINHEYNKGLPQARRTGLQQASGEYIIHCDSDDWPDNNLYEIMYNEAVRNDYDVVVCDRFETDGQSGKRYKGLTTDNVSDLILDMMYVRCGWQVWNKMIKRTIYDSNVVFPTFAMGEDMVIMLQLLTSCKKVGYVSGAVYNYFLNNESIVRKLTEETCVKQYKQMMTNISILEEFLNKKGVINYYAQGINHIKFKIKGLMLPLLGREDYYKEYKNLYRGVEYTIIKDKRSSFKERLLATLIILGLFPYPRNKYSYLIEKQ